MKLIIACDPQGGIGYKNKLPWTSLQGDLFRFRQLTQNQIVVMGRNTWESLPKRPLPNRVNIVVSSTVGIGLHDGAIWIPTLTNQCVPAGSWLIGGGQLIATAWNLINEVYLSRTYAKHRCDTYIDLVKLQSEFELTESTNCADHAFEIWKRT